MSDQPYYQTKRETKKPTRHEVPFIKNILLARELNGNGIYAYCDAEILSYGNMWQMGEAVYQHVTVSDGQTEIEIQVRIYEPTDAYDTLGWHILKLRWVGTPSLDNISGIIQARI